MGIWNRIIGDRLRPTAETISITELVPDARHRKQTFARFTFGDGAYNWLNIPAWANGFKIRSDQVVLFAVNPDLRGASGSRDASHDQYSVVQTPAGGAEVTIDAGEVVTGLVFADETEVRLIEPGGGTLVLIGTVIATDVVVEFF